MREVDEQSVTAEVIRRLADTPDPRMRTIMTALVRHLHGFAREVALTEAEWTEAIGFLNRTGATCTETRQEFILLSDTLGLSTLVDAINNQVPGATQSTVLGPFFVEHAPAMENGADIDGGTGGGAPLFVDVSVADMQGRPIAGAQVDVWHSDAGGTYDIQGGSDAELARRARIKADDEGRVRFRTTMPDSYPVPADGPVGAMLRATGRHPMRPAHVHFMITAPGFRRLVTHLFVAGDAYLDSDAVFGVKDSLIAEYATHPPGRAPDGTIVDAAFRTLSYDFVLAPEGAA